MNLILFVKAKGENIIVLPDGVRTKELTYSVKGVDGIPDNLTSIVNKTIIVDNQGSEVDNGVAYLRQSIGAALPYIHERETRDFIVSMHAE